MCGIAGWQGTFQLSNKNVLSHRGPDDFGEHSYHQSSLFHWRLSIIDLAPSGHQPISNEDGSIWLTFNGEIYNYKELSQKLRQNGHRFRGSMDGEVIVHLYEERGIDFLNELRGMFGFALLDQRSQTLFLAQDPFGIKQVYYGNFNEGVAFASELRVFNHLGVKDLKVDREAVTLYHRLNYIPAPWTIWQDCKKLLPGHYLVIKDNKIQKLEKYYQWPQDAQRYSNVEYALQQLDNTLQDSVEKHLIADVPLGCFLSGGLDSGLITAIAQKKVRNPVKTFTISFPEVPYYDESAQAEETARYLQTDHTTIPVTQNTVFDTLRDIVGHIDEPFADSSIIPTAIISKVSRDYVKVILSGDGADELFAGYSKHQGFRLAQSFKWTAPLLKVLGNLPISEKRTSALGDKFRQIRKLSSLMSGDSTLMMIRNMNVFDEKALARLYPDENVSDPLYSYCQKILEGAGVQTSLIDKMLFLDANLVLPYDMLTKVDRASMRYALEVRVPYVDREVVKTAMMIPDKWKLNGFSRKWILKRLAQKYLSEKIIARPKRGFGIPIGEWMRQSHKDYFYENVMGSHVIKSGMMNKTYVQTLFDEHFAAKNDHFWKIWNVFVLCKWWDNCHSGK